MHFKKEEEEVETNSMDKHVSLDVFMKITKNDSKRIEDLPLPLIMSRLWFGLIKCYHLIANHL